MNVAPSAECQLAALLSTQGARRSLTLVVPVFNEAPCVAPCAAAIAAALREVDLEWSVIWVDDGSSDGTAAELMRLAEAEPQRHRVAILARNFGKDAALTAGLDFADGDAVIPLDVDLQDPPELIPEMVRRWRDGADIVDARRRVRSGEGMLKRVSASLFYRVMAGPLHVRLPQDVGDFRLIDRRVLHVLGTMRERSRFFKGLVAWPGFRSVQVYYDRPPRRRGHTAWSFWRLWNYALDGIASFSTAPLRVWTYIGLLVSGAAMTYGLCLVVRKLVWGADVPGYTSIMAAMLFLGGIQLIGMGVLGEYIGRILEESKGRPLYVVSQMRGLS